MLEVRVLLLVSHRRLLERVGPLGLACRTIEVSEPVHPFLGSPRIDDEGR